MASIVTITAAAPKVEVKAGGYGEYVFTVTNTTGNALRMGSKVLVDGATDESWLTIEGAAERELAKGMTDQVKVRCDLPPATTAGRYTFRLLAYSCHSPGEDFTEGPVVGIEVPESKVVTPTPIPTKFPWLIVAAVTAVVVIGGIIAYVFVATPKATEVPPEAATEVPLKATVYQHCNYAGYAVDLHPGSYNLADLTNRGMRNDDISAVRVPDGMKVTFYQHNGFQGMSWVSTGNDSCFANTAGHNDVVSSIKVELIK